MEVCTCSRVVVSVIGFVDYGGVVFYFGDLSVVSDYAVVAACDTRRAGRDVVGI